MGVESVAADKCCMCGRCTKESWTFNGGCCPTNPWPITICNNCVPCPRPELSNSFEIEEEHMPGRDEEMRSPEEISATGSVQPLDGLREKLRHLQLQAEDVIRQEIYREFESMLRELTQQRDEARERAQPGEQKNNSKGYRYVEYLQEQLKKKDQIIRTLRGEISNFRTWLGNATAELPDDIYVIFRAKTPRTNITYSELAEAVKILREQREELIRQKACRDIEKNGFNGTLEEFHSLTERPALNTVHEHDQRAEKDHEAVSVLLSLINDACCMAQGARGNPEKLEQVRAHVANVLPLKALGQTPKEEQGKEARR